MYLGSIPLSIKGGESLVSDFGSVVPIYKLQLTSINFIERSRNIFGPLSNPPTTLFGVLISFSYDVPVLQATRR